MSEEMVRTEEMAKVDEAKREFMKKFGKYAATAPLGMYLLMGPGASKAQASATIACETPYYTEIGTLKDNQHIYKTTKYNDGTTFNSEVKPGDDDYLYEFKKFEPYL